MRTSRRAGLLLTAVSIMAFGMTFVLAGGEIDLSIGYVSGVAGWIVAELQMPGGSWEIKGIAAIVIAVIAAHAGVRAGICMMPVPHLIFDVRARVQAIGDTLSALPLAPRHFTLYFKFESEELTDQSRALVKEVLDAVTARPVPAPQPSTSATARGPSRSAGS